MTLQKAKNKFAILVSGNGSNAQNLIETARRLGEEVACVISDNPNAYALVRCQKLGVKAFVVEKVASRRSHEAQILKILRQRQVNWTFLAGYMRLLSEEFLRHFYNEEHKVAQVVNIHPSLLPSYPGLNAYERAFADKAPLAGVTTHFVDAGMDTGPIIEQSSFKLDAADDLQSFIKKGMRLERELYSRVLENIISNNIWNPNER